MESIDVQGLGTPPDSPPRDRHLSGLRRMVATILLGIGLVAAGGVAIVSAASPDPSASAAPSAAGGSSGGSGSSASPAPNHNCPNMPAG